MPSEFDVNPRIEVSSIPYVRELMDLCQFSSSGGLGSTVFN
nr:hypothetical protein [Nitrosopumilus oxyclinae]